MALGFKFAVFVLDPALLYEGDRKVYFCSDNAASSRCKRWDSSEGANLFENLFLQPKPAGLLNKYPSIRQAEILVSETIKPSYIKGAHFENGADVKYIQEIVGEELGQLLEINSYFFDYAIGDSIWNEKPKKPGYTSNK